MSTATTRLNMTKPASSENVDISVLNTNFDLTDSAVGATVASAASRPASTWQGRVWYAQDTDKIYVNEAAGSSAVAVWADPVAQALAGAVAVGGALTVAGGITVTGKGERTFIKKAASQSYASQTTLQNDTDFVFSLAASAVYTLRTFLAVTGAAAGDVKVAWAFTGAASAANGDGRGCMGPQIATTDVAVTSMRSSHHNWTTSVPYGLDGSAAAHIEERGVLNLASSGSGTLTMQWAQNTSNATSTVMDSRSFAILERIS